MSAAQQIADLEARVLAGDDLSVEDGLRLLEELGPAAHDELLASADRIRRQFVGDEVHLCSIINAKSGRCSEDCGFCAQSARFDTGVDEYGLIDEETARKAARRARENGAEALGLVAAWRGLGQGPELERVLKLVREASDEGRVHVDASLGLIDDPAVAQALADAGLHTYNHNLETARSNFDEVCETHSWDDRKRTIQLVREAGMHVCSGGIVGMGETLRQRVELAAELRELDPDLIPLNFLNPIEGTPQGEAQPVMPADEALRSIAVFRFMLPRHHIMVAGGREVVLGERQADMYKAGASAAMVGDYLTTGGRSAEQDRAQLDAEGWQPRVEPLAADAEAARPPHDESAPWRRPIGRRGDVTADAVERAAAGDLEPWTQAGLGRELRQVCAGPGACVDVDGRSAVSFASCDYLGLARHPRLTEASLQATRESGTSRGSARLLSGHDGGLVALESSLAEVFRAPAALVFGSGYLANVAAVTSLAGQGDLIVSDVLSHASSIDACRLSRATVRRVDPRDRDALRATMADAGDFRRVLLLVVGVPSMDGAPRPLDLVVDEADRVGAWVVVDDAHGLGSVGPGGRGTAAAFGVSERVALQVGNLGKALGSYGAFVLCGETTREWLVQTARPFVFTCSLPPGVVAAADAGVRLLGDEPERPLRLQERSRALRRRLAQLGVDVLDDEPQADGSTRVSPVIPVLVGAAGRAVDVAAQLLERGWFVPAVRPPTVPEGGSRLRLTVSVHHDDDQLAGVSAALQEVLR